MREGLVNVALGKVPADLAIKNGRLVNVNTCEIEDSVGVAVKGKRIALVGDVKHCIGENTVAIDAGRKYLVPGLLDAHVHIESSMVTVTQFARAVLPRGTTGVFIDPHEIANVLGMSGIRLMLDEGKDLPLKVFITLPSCVPSAPGLETTGAEIGPAEIAEGLKWGGVVGLAEVMNFPGVLMGDPKMHGEIEAALERRGAVEGHAPGLLGKELCAYIAAGVRSDHESFAREEAVEKLRLGMKLEVREGSTAKNLADLIKPILELKLDARHCLLATDDRHPEDLLKEGHMDHVLRRAVEEGVDPVRAIQMATINTAEHFRVDEDLGSISPGKLADILIVDDLQKFEIGAVITNGKLVAKNGRLLEELQTPSYPRFARETMNLRRVRPEDFAIAAPIKAGKVKVRVIGLIGGQIITEHEIAALDVEDGHIRPDIASDILKVAVVERHRATGNIGLGLVRGFGMQEGAIASSVGHDAHNITVVGVSDPEIAAGVNAVAKMGGGQVAVRGGKVLAKVELPIAGLMSNKPVESISAQLKRLHRAARDLKIRVKSPFMCLSFLPLAVVPKLRITDKGLVDVEDFRLVDLFLR
ncbi:MAG: adenine deaminase [Candidatus Hodarchaeaceae archaeon]|nr:adenine deaminase [Candidatus Hodarchaeaceae archaeon]